MPRKAPLRRIVHHPGSKASRIEAWVRTVALQQRGTPSSYARAATIALGFAVSRCDVSHALKNLGVVSKTYAIVPGLSVPAERALYVQQMNTIASSADQVLFTDEKKIKKDEFHYRFSNFGYAPPGVRLSPGFVSLSLSQMVCTQLIKFSQTCTSGNTSSACPH